MQPGTGMLFAICGPSGSGKDTLIDWLRARLDERGDVLFARRVVTRDADIGLEDHATLGKAAFEAQDRAGAFCVSWQAHGLSYGIPAAVKQHVDAGGIAICNGSRRALPAMAKAFANMTVISLSVERAVLEKRLAARGRESAAEIAARLERASEQISGAFPVVPVDNSGAIEIAGRKVLWLVNETLPGVHAAV